ncbi:glutamate racemase [Aquimarina sp. W85]|uniref:glutamate racemase n=1 Tax=Aquimarina rhodophyticola TaxID=3342246 RepID=UPI003670C7FA
MKQYPIGIFDSGIGGTSIWKAIVNLLPMEDTIYLADSYYAPYGKRSKDEIIALSVKNTEKLIRLGAKMIVVACNTATTNAIEHLRMSYNIPFIGIEPAIKPAALRTKTKSIGVLATKGTLSSELFAKTSNKYSDTIQIHEIIGSGLVELIENGDIYSSEMKSLLRSYTDSFIKKDIDYLVLGCTHYPYLIPQLSKLLPSNIEIIDSGEAVARQTKTVLNELGLASDSRLEPRTYQFYTNGTIEPLKQVLAPYIEKVSIAYLKF